METQKKNVDKKEASLRNSVPVPIKNLSANFVSFNGLVDGKEHVALDFRKKTHIQEDVVTVRMHSECLTGDIFGSARCDCGEQLDEATNKLAAVNGVLLYLRQEGRGIGLYNKLDAYDLQLKGFNTYEANRKLGLADDLRDYEVAAQMLKAMGIKKVRLLTNNPLKKKQLQDYGIEVVERISTGVFVKDGNECYLKAKVEVTGHSIDLTSLAI